MKARLGCLLALLATGPCACRLDPIALLGRACPCPDELTCEPASNRCISRGIDIDAGADLADGADASSGLPPPIGYWPLDEQQGVSVADVGSGHHDGVILGGAPIWIGDAQRSRALQLPVGVSLRVAALDGAAFPLAGTLAFWFRGDVIATTPVLRAIFDGWDDSRDHFFIRVAADDKIQTAGNMAGGKPYVVTTSQAAARDVWHRLVMTWQTGAGASFTVQLDDALFSAPLDTTWTPAQQAFTFGGGFPDLLLDDIRLYDRPLTASEAARLP